MESIRGTITKFIYKNPSTGWKVGKFQPEAKGQQEFTIKGNILESYLDCDVEIKGDWVDDPNYGRGFQISAVIRQAPSKLQTIQQWLALNVKGLGPGTSKKVIEQFGDSIRAVLEFSPQQIADIKGISMATAQNAFAAWAENPQQREMQLLLLEGGLSHLLAGKVNKRFGPSSVQIITDNPYRLTQVSGIGFKSADKMALSWGWSPQRPERLDAAAIDLLNEAVDEGHTFMNKSELVGAICRKAEIEVGEKTEMLPEPVAVAAVQRLIELEEVKLETVRTGPVTHELIYLPKYYDMEKEAAERIARLVTMPHVPPANIEKVLTKVEKKLSLQLSEQQRSGVVTALSNNFSITTGLPGTGKTSTVKALVNAARELGLYVQLAAPTGRAAKRLSEVTEMQAVTIHRLLGYSQETYGFLMDEKNKLTCDMLIIDEASMVDLDLMVALLRAVPDTCSTVWIGDVNQLPSVGAGTVLRDLINSKRIKTTVLDKIFRQAEGSLIIQNAHRIHRGEMPAFPPKGADGDSYWVKVPRAKNEKTDRVTDDLEFVKDKLTEIYTRLETKYGYDPVTDIQVLTPMRIGPAGYLVLNQHIQEIVNPNGRRIQVGAQIFRQGDRVMQTKNDYELEVYNGDVGVIRGVMESDRALMIEWSDRTEAYPFESVDNLALSYAVSTHKAQGSEFPVTILVLLNHHYVMLDRNMVYTAATRARKLCVYLASHGALDTAVTTQKVLKRNSLLTQRIRISVDRESRPTVAA
jgi:exodeoxyribonuclease V alpha subunit